MDAKTILATLTRLALASIAGTLVKDGLLQASATQTFIGAGMLVATGMWGLWNGYGKDIAKASLIILRAKVLNAAEQAQRRPAAAAPALASIAAHVEATAPEAASASPASPPVASAIALAIGLSLVLAGHPAAAQTRLPSAAPKLTGNPVRDIGDAIKGDQSAAAQKSIESFLAKPFQDLADFIGTDNEAAIALSTAVPELQDGHGQQCWMATKQFGDVIKAHPVPLTLKAQTDLEALRLLAMAANNLCANVHCTQVFADLGNAVQTLAPVNASIPIPSLHDLCAKVPQVAVVAPVAIPSPAPAAPTP